MWTTKIFSISQGGVRQRGALDKGFYGSVLGILIYLLNFLIKFKKNYVKNMFRITDYKIKTFNNYSNKK